MTNNQEPVPEAATDRTNTDTANSGHSKGAAPTPAKGAVMTRLGRTTKLPTYLDEYVTSETDVANTRRYDTIVACTDYMDPVSFRLTGNQDNFYYHEILREPEKAEFIKAMKEEIDNHNNNGNWTPVLRSSLPSDIKVI
jgi:hypothetical protein